MQYRIIQQGKIMDQITHQIAAIMDANDVLDTVASAGMVAAQDDGRAVATWETKSGQTRVAYTDRGALSAPLQVRKNAAYARTLSAVNNGRYVGFCKDAHAAMTAGHRKSFAARFAYVLVGDAPATVVIEGRTYTLAKAEPQLGDRINKQQFRAICEFEAAPTVIVNKVEEPKPLKKSAQWMSDLAAEWLAANPA